MTSILAQILSVLGFLENNLLGKIQALSSQYPESDEAKNAFLEWFKMNVGDKLRPETAAALAVQAWQELTGEDPGYSTHHGSGI